MVGVIPGYFSVYPKLNCGLKALETLPLELKNSGSSRPLIIAKAGGDLKRKVKTLEKAFAESPDFCASVFIVSDRSGPEDLDKALADSRADSIICLGTGTIPLVKASVGNRLHDSPAGVPAKTSKRIMPWACVPDGTLRGGEASGFSILAGQPCFSDKLFPEWIILDPRLCGDFTKESITALALRSLSFSAQALFYVPSPSPVLTSYAEAALNTAFSVLSFLFPAAAHNISPFLLSGTAVPNSKAEAAFTAGLCSVLSDMTASNTRGPLLSAEQLLMPLGPSDFFPAALFLPALLSRKSDTSPVSGQVSDLMLMLYAKASEQYPELFGPRAAGKKIMLDNKGTILSPGRDFSQPGFTEGLKDLFALFEKEGF